MTHVDDKNVFLLVNPFIMHLPKVANLIKRYSKDRVICTSVNLTELKKKIVEVLGSKTTVILCGGDGTVNLAINALVLANLLEDRKLLLISGGTGNDLYYSLNLITSQEHNLKSLGVNIPVWQVDGYYFSNYVSFGFDAKIIKKFQFYRKYIKKMPFLNKILYGLLWIVEFFKKQKYNIKLIIKGKEEEICCRNLIIANISSYGGGRKIENCLFSLEKKLVILIQKSRYDLFFFHVLRYFDLNNKWFCQEVEVLLNNDKTCIQVDGEAVTFKKRNIKFSCHHQAKFFLQI